MKNYDGPLYAPWSAVVKGRGFDPVEKRKKEKLVKAELKAEKNFEESQKKVLKALNKKMNDDIKKKHGSNKNNDDAKRDGGLPHQYPKDKCIYQSSQSNLKKTMCGAPTEINIRNGINIFEMFLHPNPKYINTSSERSLNSSLVSFPDKTASEVLFFLNNDFFSLK